MDGGRQHAEGLPSPIHELVVEVVLGEVESGAELCALHLPQYYFYKLFLTVGSGAELCAPNPFPTSSLL